jgi:hypothetical protein
VILLLYGILISRLLTMDERSKHEDLCGLSRWSVIPYVHGRTFIVQGRAVTLRPGARQVVPRWLKPYTTSMVLMDRSNK